VAPFTLAALLRGTEAFLFDLMEAPSFARELMVLAKESMLALIDLAVLEGAVPSVADPLASTSVISPAMYREFAFPGEKELIACIRRIGFDAMLHICGETEPILEDVARTGADMFSFDRVPISAAAEKVGKSMRLVGNIDPVQLMLSSPEEIQRDARECIEAGKRSPRGFILATGCEVPLDTPPENIEALMKAGDKYGQLWHPADQTGGGQ
jgi:uroporphyrinogen decarboxylase